MTLYLALQRAAGFGRLRPRQRRRCWLVLSILLSLTPQVSVAAEPPFKTSSFQHVADKQPLRDLLNTFANAQGWSISLSGVSDDAVSARFSMAAPRFWDLITSSHNLLWYFDGHVMHVCAGADMRTEMFPMSEEAFRRLRASLERLDIADRRFPLRYDAGSSMAIAAGPPRMLEMVGAMAIRVDGDGAYSGDYAVRVVPLKAARAADVTLMLGNTPVLLEGVASVVRRTMGLDDKADKADAAAAAAGAGPDAAQRLQGAVATGAARDLSVKPAPAARSLFGNAVGAAPSAAATPPVVVHPGSAAGPGRPRVEADAATNAVIVRDRSSRLPQYLDLIAQLDQARPLVEIEARMVEVESGQLDELGVDWSVANSRGSASVTGGVGALQPQIVATLVEDAVTRLLARVRALQSEGRGKLVMTPRILAMDNTEAVIENTETAYVQVAGNLEANLFSVSTGSALRILPTVLAGGQPPRVRLVVSIEDGTFLPQAVKDVPIVQRSRIFTQSEIEDGATLVVGGLSDVRDSRRHDGLPGLSRLPLVGAAFGFKSEGGRSRERLYLLTPRIVGLAPAAGAGPASFAPAAAAGPIAAAAGPIAAAAAPTAAAALAQPAAPAPVRIIDPWALGVLRP